MLIIKGSWSALGGVLVTGVNAGGPPVMIWGWVGISIVSLCVAYSMAEMCSEYPVAGGQYSWVYILSPKSIRRQFSYLTGWFMIIGKFSYEMKPLESRSTILLTSIRYPSHGCYKFFHRSKLHPWTSESSLPRLRN